MLTRLDHLVILVRDLDFAAAGYERLGFAVTPGGEHADGLTRNALIPFEDGSYFELVSFLNPEDTRDNVWGWRTFLPHEGLIDYCVASDDMAAEHPNGVTGISRLEIAASDAKEAAASLTALIGRSSDTGTPMQLGDCSLSPVTAEREDEARRLETRGSGPLTVDLVGETPGRALALDPLLTHGVGIRLPPRSSEG